MMSSPEKPIQTQVERTVYPKMDRQVLPDESETLPVFEAHGVSEEEMGEGEFIQHFSHLTLEVTDLDRSDEWYRDVIGLDLLGRNLTAEVRRHSVFQMNTGQLFILVELREGEELRHRLPGRSIIHHALVLTPNQYRRAWTRLQEYGYDVTDTRLALRTVGEYSIDCADPDGHRFQLQTYGPESQDVILAHVGMVDCGLADSYKVGDVKTSKAGNFFVVRVREGFFALSRWCTHKNGTIVYQKAHWRFQCPFHGATYDRRGIPTGLRTSVPLRLHPISFSPDGRLLVNTDELIERSVFDPKQAVQPPEAIGAAAAGSS